MLGLVSTCTSTLFVFPAASGFIYRSQRAVILSTVSVLMAILFVYTIDLSGQCTTSAIDKDDLGAIVADRFLVLFNAIVGNCLVLVAIVGQSQKSMLLHVEAATSAANLADVRREVLHRVTHELRTPLNGIVGSVELLTVSETLGSEDIENALTIKSRLDTIVNICDNVLLAAKSSSKKEDPAKTPFRLAGNLPIDAVNEVFTSTAAASGIDLKTEYSYPDVWVKGMKFELRQVLVNLVGNAMKFTENGSITVRVRGASKPAPTSETPTITCTFEVEDTGVGIDMDTKHMLFEAFHQGEHNDVSRRHKGTGLGLTICKDLVRQMGGDLDVEGHRGQGSKF